MFGLQEDWCGDGEIKMAVRYLYYLRDKRLWNIWHNMIQRCSNKNHGSYKNYGGRGISVCHEWNDYELFAMWAFESGYADNLTIDRIDNNGNYEPSNCRWATMKEQICHRRNSRNITINGITKTLKEWAIEYGINPKTVYYRVNRGMDAVEALTKRPNYKQRK